MNGFKHSRAKTDLSKNLSGDYHVAEFREGLVETARARWSWEGVARGVIDAACGQLDALPSP